MTTVPNPRRGSKSTGNPYLDTLYTMPTRVQQTTSPRTLGPSFHTADQEDQRNYLGAGYDGRDSYNADPAMRIAEQDTRRDQNPLSLQGPSSPAFANVIRTRRHPDGTLDAVRLEATENGWIDLGGPTPRDFRVVIGT